jgi:hypothetical protein
MYSQALFNRAFRKSPSFESRNEAVAAWMRQGERLAAQLVTDKWSPDRFTEALKVIRRLSRNKYPSKFIPDLRRLCAECGVALVIARTPAGCPASGATEFLSRNKALILLSFRFKTDDQFWFSFFHEAGHLLLHDMDDVFIDENSRGSADSQYEKEANEFAANWLVPSEQRSEMMGLPRRALDVIRFAMLSGISPGIVVGQLQHARRLERSQLNKLKRHYEDSDIDQILSL